MHVTAVARAVCDGLSAVQKMDFVMHIEMQVVLSLIMTLPSLYCDFTLININSIY